MGYVVSALVALTSLVVSTFALSNVLLPIFYTIPRLKQEKIDGNLIRTVPLRKILGPPITWLLLFGTGLYYVLSNYPGYTVEIIVPIGLIGFGLIRRIGEKNQDMEDDFKASYKNYLKDTKYSSAHSELNNYRRKYDPNSSTAQGFIIPNSKIKSMEIRAFERYSTKDYKSTIAICDKILDLNPKSQSSLRMRAGSLEVLNFNLEAIEDYKTLLSLDGTDGNIFGLLGLAYFKIGDVDEALINLRSAVDRGAMMYQINLKMFDTMNREMKDIVKRKNHIPKNLLIRDKSKFEELLTDVDRKDYNDSILSMVSKFRETLSLDPNNQELKNLLEYIQTKLN